jgi:class 3 adenylate cyclase
VVEGVPRTHYAKAADGVNVAYQVFGDGAIDLVFVPGFISHLDVMWEHPTVVRMFRRLGSIARVVTFDKRGTGASDRSDELPDLDQRMLDVKAVVDAVGLERPALLGISEGGAMAMVYAATFPERVRSLALFGAFANIFRTDDHPIGASIDDHERFTAYLEERWGTGVGLEWWAPSIAHDSGEREWWARLQRLAASPRAAGRLLASQNLVDARGALPLISAPTLITHRTDDRLVGIEHARELAAGIRGATLVEFPGEDHLPWTSNVDDIVDEIARFLSGSTPDTEPDRRLATVLFTDIVSSTERLREMGDAAWRTSLDAHDRLVRSIVREHRGRVVQFTGDGFLAVFDGPTRAVKCAHAITQAGEQFGGGIRAGLHTGEVTERGPDVAGIAVHIAARVANHAGPGEVLVSRTVVDLVAGSGLAFADRGEHELKGVEQPWRLFRLDTAT